MPKSRKGIMFQDLTGWCEDSKLGHLMSLVMEFEDPLVVELGIYGGKSFIPMACVCKSKKKGKCFGVDPWTNEASIEGWEEGGNKDWWTKLDHENIMRKFFEGVARYDVADYVEIYRAKSQDCVHRFKDYSIDVLHIDANHAEERALDDVNKYVPKVRNGGYIALDDIDWPTTRKAQNRLIQLGCKELYRFDHWGLYQRICNPTQDTQI